MSFQIRINPQALRAAAQRRAQVQEATRECTAQLENMRNRLNAAWDGGASNQALESMDDIIESVKSLAEGTDVTANVLQAIASMFEELDETLSAGSAVAVPVYAKRIACPILPGFILRLSGNLRIIPDEVRESADMGREVSKRFTEAADEIWSQVQSLEDVWEGKSFNKFYDESKELVNGFKELSDAVDSLCTKLYVAAERYEEIDNALWN